MKKNILFRRFIIVVSVFAFQGTIANVNAQSKEQTLHDLNSLLINTVMDDLFTPPVACRIYTYPNIAFYECIRYQNPAYSSLAGKLNGLTPLPQPDRPHTDFFIAAYIA